MNPVALIQSNAQLIGLADESIHCVVTSPPYWNLRDYGTAEWIGGDDPDCDHKPGSVTRVGKTTLQGGKKTTGHMQEGFGRICPKCGAERVDDQIGLEPTPEKYVESIVNVFREIRRVLHPSGVVWLNLGDSYNGSGGDNGQGGLVDHLDREFVGGQNVKNLKPKDLVGIPWTVAFALRLDGWYLRSEVIWHKPNPMPESVQDRPTRAHEQIFLFSKSKQYFYDIDAIREPYAADTIPRSLRAVGGDHKMIDGVPGQEKPHTILQERENGAGANMNPDGRNKRSVWSVDDVMREFFLYLRGQGVDVDGLIDDFLKDDRKTDVWEITTKSFHGKHFATFPNDLVEPCILAGTSERGVCPKCGAPWRRHFERETVLERGRNVVGLGSKTYDVRNNSPDGTTGLHHERYSTFIGWRPTCDRDCGQYKFVGLWRSKVYGDKDDEYYWLDWKYRMRRRALVKYWQDAETKPAVVLDPFVGSGTSVEVARNNNRFGVGVDLSMEYLLIARERLGLNILDEWMNGIKVRENDFEGLPMFGGLEQ